MVGFTGSRILSPAYAPLVAQVVGQFSGPLAVGCAKGADNYVRIAAPHAQVFYAAAQVGPAKARLVKRSMAMVQAVASSSSPLVVGFVAEPCPVGLMPSAQAFQGLGSGSWATLAYALAHGVTIQVYSCNNLFGLRLPPWGNWQKVGNVLGVVCWQLAPDGSQARLF